MSLLRRLLYDGYGLVLWVVVTVLRNLTLVNNLRFDTLLLSITLTIINGAGILSCISRYIGSLTSVLHHFVKTIIHVGTLPSLDRFNLLASTKRLPMTRGRFTLARIRSPMGATCHCILRIQIRSWCLL